MANDWFVKIDNKVESGPISSDTLKQLAQQGKIKRDTPLKKGASGNWISAGSIKGLPFPTAPQLVRSSPANDMQWAEAWDKAASPTTDRIDTPKESGAGTAPCSYDEFVRDSQPVGTLASNDSRIPDDFFSVSHRPPSSVVPKKSAVWTVLRLAGLATWAVLRVLVSAVRSVDGIMLRVAGGPKNVIPYRLVQVVVVGVLAAVLIISQQSKTGNNERDEGSIATNTEQAAVADHNAEDLATAEADRQREERRKQAEIEHKRIEDQRIAGQDRIDAAKKAIRNSNERREQLVAKARREREDADRERAEAERRRSNELRAEEARKAMVEYDVNGLVLLKQTLHGKMDESSIVITGEVINRRGYKLSLVSISFDLLDESGARVGTAADVISSLGAGDTWRFKATGFGSDFSKFRFSELSGF